MFQLFRQLRPFRFLISIVLVLVFLQSLSNLYLPTLLSDIVNTGIVKGDNGYIIKIGSFMLLISALGAVCIIISSFLSSKVASSFGQNLRMKLFSHVEQFSLSEFDRIGTASLITRTTNDIQQVQQVLIMMLRMFVSAPLMCIGGVIMAVSKDAHLSLIFVVVIPLIALSIFLVVRRAVPLFRTVQKRLDKLNLVLREALTGIRVIRSFNRISYEQQRFDGANKQLMETSMRVNKMMAILMPLMMLIMNGSTLAIVWFGSKRINMGDMQVGDLIAFIQYSTQIMFSLIMVSMMFVMIPRASASAARINEVLAIVPDITELDHAVEPIALTDRENQDKLIFQNVTFSYPGAEKPALSNISFTAKSGEITAIIGGTGSGKSTLINLIPRFYDVNEGSIMIGGSDIKSIRLEQLRGLLGLVPQKAVLFTGSINDNIRYGKEDATDEEIQHAANIAQATEFISELEEGFDSPISQGGSNVSGGQKQRLSIARALVRQPLVYLFDDSFSALDFKTDAKLRAALRAETKESIVMIVAQRVSTVMNADRIIVLDQGKVAGIGTHAELMERSSVYREIVLSQLSEEEIA